MSMLESIRKNQEAAQKVINDFAIKTGVSSSVLTLFTKELMKALLNRAEDAECYTIDMLEDIQRLGELTR